jgi:hypothetical protein
MEVEEALLLVTLPFPLALVLYQVISVSQQSYSVQ